MFIVLGRFSCKFLEVGFSGLFVFISCRFIFLLVVFCIVSFFVYLKFGKGIENLGFFVKVIFNIFLGNKVKVNFFSFWGFFVIIVIFIEN